MRASRVHASRAEGRIPCGKADEPPRWEARGATPRSCVRTIGRRWIRHAPAEDTRHQRARYCSGAERATPGSLGVPYGHVWAAPGGARGPPNPNMTIGPGRRGRHQHSAHRLSEVAATRVEPRATSYAEPIFIAVGLLSAGSGTAKSANSSIGVWRRSQLRTSFAQYTGGDVALRFLLAPSSLIPASDPTAVDVTPALLREANAHRDMIFLNMTEGLYRCASWWRERPLGSATARHPAWGCHSGSGRALLWSNCCAAQSPMRGQDVEPASTEAADCKAFHPRLHLQVPRVAAARADALPTRALLRARRR